MASTLLIAKNPDDMTTTYATVRYERAPDSSGVPGAFTEITSKAIDTTNETTNYQDNGGLTTDWYRFRFADTPGTGFSDYTASRQAGQYLVRDWLKSDIPDTDLVDGDWDRWRDQVLLDMQAKQLGRPVYPPQSFTPGTATDEWVGIHADIRRVIRVEVYDSAGYFQTQTPQFMQWGRYLRLFFPNTSKTYKIYGLGEIRNMGDLDDELFNILYWGIRIRYIDKRLADRVNFKQFLVADKVSDVTEPQLKQYRDVAQREYDSRILDIRNNFNLTVASGS